MNYVVPKEVCLQISKVNNSLKVSESVLKGISNKTVKRNSRI